MKARCLLVPLLFVALIITGMNVYATPAANITQEYIEKEGIQKPKIITSEQSLETIWPEEDRFEESMTVTSGNLIYYPDVDYGSLIMLPYSNSPEAELLSGEESPH